MDPIATPGPIHDVAEHLFLQMDKETLMDCRLVSKAWKKFLDSHTFWFKKLTFKYAHLEEGWKSLAIVVMETNDIDNEGDNMNIRVPSHKLIFLENLKKRQFS